MTAPTGTYLGVVLLKVERTLWDRELDEGVLESCCSGVVRGPRMLTAKREQHSVGTAEVFFAAQGTSGIPWHLSKALDKSGISWHTLLFHFPP